MTPARFALSLLALTLAACGQPDAEAPPLGEPITDPPVGMPDKADGAHRDRMLQTPWGGPDPAQWTPEATLANAVEAALAEPGVVRVAVPVKFQGSAVFPFGDGQSNAAVDFPWWSAARPPVVASLLADGRVTIRFDRALGLAGDVEARVEDREPVRLPLRLTDSGDGLVTWAPELLPDHERITLRPAGWQDAFGIGFHHPVTSADALAASVPAALRPAGPLPDLASVGARARRMGMPAIEVLTTQGAGAGYNATPYATGVTHGSVPGRTTAVGGARTWLTESPFKQLYICLDGRDPAAEAATGAPSGAGWHAIGDPAESLLNTVEDAPLLAGWGQAQLFAADEWGFAFGEGGPAYGLTDIATFSHLEPGQALVTGKPTDHAPAVYHWYAVHTATPLCTEVWVHPCGIDEAEQFACRPSPVQLQVHGAHTQPGEGIFVVGDHPALGAWDPAAALPLSPANYPSWFATVHLQPGTEVTFKFIRKDSAGTVTWMGGADLTWTVPFAPTGSFEAQWSE